MTYGFRIIADNGITQIGPYQQHALVYSGQKGSVTTGSPTVYGYGSEVQCDIALSAPLMAVAAQSGAIVALIRATRLNASTWRLFYVCSGPPGTVIDYWGFAVSRDLGMPSGNGLTIYNADGSLAYSSSLGSANIVTATSAAQTHFDLPNSRSYAAINGTVVRSMVRTGNLISVDDRTGRETWSVQQSAYLYGTYVIGSYGGGMARVGTDRMIVSASTGRASSDPNYSEGPTQSQTLFVDVTGL